MTFQRVTPFVLIAYMLSMFALTIQAIGKLSYYGDEIIHVDKIRTFLEHGLYTVTVGPGPDGTLVSTFGNPYVYGPLFTLLAHIFASALGAETWGSVLTTDAAYQARHIFVALFSLFGVFGLVWTVKLFTRSWNWGLAAGSMLMSIPLWTGSAMFNVKDIPLATGFTLFTAGCIALFIEPTENLRNQRLVGRLFLFLGALIFWGVRPGIWPAMVLGVLAVFLLSARIENFSNWRVPLRRLRSMSVAIGLSYLVMFLIYPKIFGQPVQLLYFSFRSTARFPHEDIILTDGEYMQMPPPWYYIPKWLGAQLPEFLVALATLAFFFGLFVALRRLISRQPHASDSLIPVFVFSLVQFAAFPLSAILLQSRITSGIRQFLFIMPGLVLLIAVTVFYFARNFKFARRRLIRALFGSLAIASTALTSFIQFQISPYVISYFNPTTFDKGINENWDVYAQKLSHGEMYSLLSYEEQMRCTVNCASAEKFPVSFQKSTPSTNSDALGYSEFVAFPNNRNSYGAKARCEKVAAKVTRPYLFSEITFSTSTICSASGKPFVSRPTDEGLLSQWWRSLAKWGWKSIGSDGLVSRSGKAAAVGWLFPSSSNNSATRYLATVSLGTTSDEALVLESTVNGQEASRSVLKPGEISTLIIQIGNLLPDLTSGDLVIIEFRLYTKDGTLAKDNIVLSSIAVDP